MLLMPAALADLMPSSESSKTMTLSAHTPINSIAFMYGSAWGLRISVMFGVTACSKVSMMGAAAFIFSFWTSTSMCLSEEEVTIAK